jgi:hypothetical protein
MQEEAKADGDWVRLLNMTPWIMGYPHRIRGFARLIKTIVDAGVVWPATGLELVAEFRKQYD